MLSRAQNVPLECPPLSSNATNPLEQATNLYVVIMKSVAQLHWFPMLEARIHTHIHTSSSIQLVSQLHCVFTSQSNQESAIHHTTHIITWSTPNHGLNTFWVTLKDNTFLYEEYFHQHLPSPLMSQPNLSFANMKLLSFGMLNFVAMVGLQNLYFTPCIV